MRHCSTVNCVAATQITCVLSFADLICTVHLQINTMEQEVAAKQQLLHQLQAENACLQSKMRVLETSLNCSTQIHGLMQLIEGVDRLGLSSSSSREESGSAGSLSLSSRSSSGVAAAAGSSGLLAPSVPGLLRSSGSTGSGSSSADAAASGLDATGSSGCLLEAQPPWYNPELLPQPQQELLVVDQLQQQAAASPSGGSSSLQAIFADAQQQQQQQQQQALALASPGAVAAGVDAAAGFSSPSAAAAAAAAVVDTGPLSGQVSSPEQGVVLYKEFLGKAQALMVQRSCSDPGEQQAQTAVCVFCALCHAAFLWYVEKVTLVLMLACAAVWWSSCKLQG
jgi:hypothetical protein